MTVVTVRGLEALRRRLETGRAVPAIKERLRQEADAIAQDAAHAAPGELGRTVEVRDKSQDETIAYDIGTAHRAGRFIEHGTRHMAARPFLFPAFLARLPGIKQTLTDTLVARFMRGRGEV